jgi:hypothetical protein
MNFRKPADMLVLIPRRILAAYTDLTMRKRDWSKLDDPACERLPARSVCAAQFKPKRTWNSHLFSNVRAGR